MAAYPDAVYVPRVVANAPLVVYTPSKTTIGYAEDVNLSNDEIVAIQTTLGLNPEGAYTDVNERLEAIEAAITGIEGGDAMTVQILTSVTGGTYYTPAGCKAIEVTCVGGGGGGGGAAATLGQTAAGSGAGSGGYCRKFIENPVTGYAYSVGAGGNGGASGNNDGTDGTETVFGSFGATWGSAGKGMAGGTTFLIRTGGAQGTGSGADINSDGEAGGYGLRLDGTNSFSGHGGGNPLGGGAKGVAPGSSGINAITPGAGGSGACASGATGNKTGGNGKKGVIIVKEYY